MSVLIPKGFKRIAHTETRRGDCTFYHNPETKQFFFKLSGRLAGPFDKADFEPLVITLKDVIDMRGVYIYLDEQCDQLSEDS